MDEALSSGDRDLDVVAAAVTCESKAAKAQEWQRFLFFEESCHQQHDADNSPSPGLLQVIGRRKPIGSMSSMEVNVDALELLDVSDQEVFAGSGGEDNTEASPVPEEELCLAVPALPGAAPRYPGPAVSGPSGSAAIEGAQPPRMDAGSEKGDAGSEKGDAGSEKGDASSEKGDAGSEKGDAGNGQLAA